jgi:pimeloyl-ACP methyl ester carboxylesterase
MSSNSSYLLLNDLRLHYLSWNGDHSGKPVLLLHGLASNAHIWDLVAPYLIKYGFRLVAPDLRGHGLTDKPDGEYSFDVYTRDLAALISTLDLEFPVLVGHSWGAMVALDYACHFAIGPRAPAGIILVDGGVSQLDAKPGATWETIQERLAPPQLAGTPLDEFLEMLRQANSHWQLTDEMVQIILANFEISEDETIYPHLSFERHMQIVRAMWEFQTYAHYEKLRVPALLVPARPAEPTDEGERNYLVLKEQGIARIMQLNPHVRLYWLRDSIHDIPLQHPAELAELVAEFVDTV